MLTVRSLSKTYPGGARPALRDVSFALAAGEAVALVGRSGSGKSTLARCLAGFLPPDSGSISIEGVAQMVFQDSPLSLNPRWTVERLLAEPFAVAGFRDAPDRARVAAAGAGFPDAYLAKPIWALSGGERQLVALSRALAVEPLSLLVLDEPFTGLDEHHQCRLADILLARRRAGLALLIATHDLHWARRLTERVLLLDQGRLVEDAPAARFFSSPAHAAGSALLAACLEPVC